MDNEAEMIESQMKQKREDLTQELDRLERQVFETVQNTTSAVADTVENVKDAVGGTFETVKSAVEGTVDSVKKCFDLRLQVQYHPWLMMGGSVAVGYVAGRLLEGLSSEQPEPVVRWGAVSPISAGGVGPTNDGPSYRREGESRFRHNVSSPEASSAGNWLGSLAEQFAPEISNLKGLAIGTLLGLVRDMVKQALPEEPGDKLSKLLDDVTEKVCGKPFRGPVVPDPVNRDLEARHGEGCSCPQTSGTTSGHGQGGVPSFGRM
jgi:hypothetical protein